MWLCVTFHNPSPRRLFNELSNDDVNLWIAKYRSEYGDQKQEIINAINCRTILRSVGVKSELKDFVPDFHKQEFSEKELSDKIAMFFGVE